jgi:hypothetical protein
MPQVPYQPFSTAQPQFQGERISVNTPGASFGENIGAALKQLGGTTEQAGTEIFQRAMALQDLKNETDARAAQTEFATKSSLAHADFGALEGKAARDGLQPYLDSQAKLREDIRGNLKSPAAQRYYDADTLPFMQRNVFSAAGHAAEENKKWVVGTANANLEVAAKTFVDPTSENEFNDKIANVRKQVDTIADTRQLDPAQKQLLEMKEISKTRMAQIVQLAQQNPPKAFDMLDKHKGDITDQDMYDKTLDIVQSRNRAVGSAMLADKVYSPNKTLAQMETEVKAQTGALSHGDPLFEKDALSALRGKVTYDRYATQQDNHNNVNKMWEGITGGVKNMQELLAKPGMQEAFDALPASDQHKIPGMINTYNASRDKQVQEGTYTKLVGMANNDVEAFLNTDLGSQPLSQPQMRALITKRAQLLKNPGDDPRLTRALGWMRGSRGSELEALGIYSRTQNNKDDYDHYTGALQSAIDVWTTEKGHPPSYKEVSEEIGPQVIRQRSEPSTFFGKYWPTTKPFYQQEVPSGWGDDLKAVAKARGEMEPTDEEINRAFVRSQFIKLYHKESPSDGGK